MDAQTCRELRTALAEEAAEVVRYLLYAEQAYSEGYPDIGALFERAARQEALEHAREHALLLGEVGTTLENLHSAIVIETADATGMYPESARRAAAAGDDAVAVLLGDFAAEKTRRLTEFQDAYDGLHRAALAG
jgi:rubrerythrin